MLLGIKGAIKWVMLLTARGWCSLGMSSELINRSAEQLCSNLFAYARQGKETNIWRDYGMSLVLTSAC